MRAKFDRWVRLYQHDAWSLASYLLSDRNEAEDAVQEAFVKLWNKGGDLEDAHVRPWLMTVTRNECIDRLRRRRPELHVVSEEPGADALAEETRDAAARLQHLIGELDEPFRSIVVLRDVLGHSYAEVAETAGLSLTQTKVYLHRARKRLRRDWENSQ